MIEITNNEHKKHNWTSEQHTEPFDHFIKSAATPAVDYTVVTTALTH